MTDPTPDVPTLRRLLAEATPGPWEANVLGSEGYDVRASRPPTSGRLSRLRVARCGYEEWETDKANAVLIVAAVNALPGILDRLEAAEGAVARCADLADRWDHHARLFSAPVDQQTREDWEHVVSNLRAALAEVTP